MAITPTRTSRRYGTIGYRTKIDARIAGLPGGKSYQASDLTPEEDPPPSTSNSQMDQDRAEGAAAAEGADAASPVPGDEAISPELAAVAEEIQATLAAEEAAGGGDSQYGPESEFSKAFAGATADPAAQVFTGLNQGPRVVRNDLAARMERLRDEAESAFAAARDRWDGYEPGAPDPGGFRAGVLDALNNAASAVGAAASAVDGASSSPDFSRDGSESTTTAGQLYQSIYDLEAPEISRIQRVLFAGGFYGQAGLEDISFGQPDELTFEAWATAVTRAARSREAGDNITVEDVLESATLGSSRVATNEDGSIATGTESGDTSDRVYEVNLTDPEAIRYAARNLAMDIVGREPTTDEQRMIVAAINSREESTQISTQNQAYDLEDAALTAASTRAGGGGIPVWVDDRTGDVLAVANPGEEDTFAGVGAPGTNAGPKVGRGNKGFQGGTVDPNVDAPTDERRMNGKGWTRSGSGRRLDVIYPGDPRFASVGGEEGAGTGTGGTIRNTQNLSIEAQVDAWYRQNRPVDVNEQTGLGALFGLVAGGGLDSPVDV